MALAVTITAPDGSQTAKTFEVSETSKVSACIPIANPQLWWPNGYGAQPLYEVKVEVKAEKPQVSASTQP